MVRQFLLQPVVVLEVVVVQVVGFLKCGGGPFGNGGGGGAGVVGGRGE